MRNAEQWRPSKFVLEGGRWRVSRDRSEVQAASTLSASLALDAYVAAIGGHARGHLADFGCGKVPLYGFYRDLVDQVTCIDWPASLHESGHIDVSADLNQPTGIADASFDTILSSSVLEHIWKHDVFWDEMVRTLRPGGKIILNVPFLYGVHEAPHDYFRWSRFALAKACEERGLTIVHLEAYAGGPDVLADLTIRSLAMVSPGLAGWAGRIAGRVLLSDAGRKLARGSIEKLPLGYMLVAQKP
jgi:SAM-dependent methyltransferase